jgi:diguanylate cyclase (GGDEF)-like protein
MFDPPREKPERELDPRALDDLRHQASEVLLRCVANVSGADRVVIAAAGAERPRPVLGAWERLPHVHGAPPGTDTAIERALASGKFEAQLDASTSQPRAIAVPVVDVSRPIAALAASFAASSDLSLERLRWILESYARVAALSLEADPMLSAVLGSSDYDPLTGCLAYVRLIEVLDIEIERAKRLNLDLSCCFIDLDRFKAVNDERGHLAGNVVLRAVGQALRESARRYDSVGRFGGDEFVVVLPETAAGAAGAVAGRLELTISDEIARATGLEMEVSIGIAPWQPGQSAAQLLDAADRSLGTAKSIADTSRARGPAR